MGLFSQYTKEGHGISKEQANAPAFIQFFRIYGTRFWSLILVNLLYMAFCLPIITIGPATAGLTKILRNWSRREHAFIWGDFWETFKNNFKQAFIVGLINIFVWALLIYDFWFFWANGAHVIYVCLIGLTAIVWLFMNYYIYTMMITFRLTILQLFKNAFIFAWAGIIRNIGITLIIGGITYVFTWFMLTPSIVWIVYFCCYFATCGYIITFITYPLIKRFMIDNVDPNTGERIEVQPEEDEE